MGSSANDDFDPYHVWLGIRKSEQPPSLYRLVGVSEFEDSMEVIRNAFLQRHSLLQALAAGKKRELASKLLEEVIRAKQILLDADAKTDYDSSLREKGRSSAGTPKFTGVSTRSKRRRFSVPMLLQIVLGGAVGIGGGIAILRYLGVNPMAQHEPVLSPALQVAASSNASERTNIPRTNPTHEFKRSELPNSGVDTEIKADKPVVENPGGTQPTAPSQVLETAEAPAMTIHELRNLRLELPAGDSIAFAELLPDTSALQHNIMLALDDQKNKVDKTHVVFADENGRDYAYVARSSGGQDGNLLVLNHLGTPAIVGKYSGGKRAGTILMLDESQRVLFAGQYKNRDLHGRAVLFERGLPVVIVDCLPKQYLAVHRCEANQIVDTIAPAEEDPDFAAIISQIEAFEGSYLETERTVRKTLSDLDEDERQLRAAAKSLEVRDRLAARRRARAAANAAAMSATVNKIPRSSQTFILRPRAPIGSPPLIRVQ